MATDSPRRMVIRESHRPEGFGGDFVEPVCVAATGSPQIDVKRRPVLFVADRNRRGAGDDVQQFVRHCIGRERRQVRAVRPDHVQPVFGQEHDRIVHPAPRLRADDPHRFRDPHQLPGRRIALHGPERSAGRTEQHRVLVRNQCRGQRTHIRPQRQLKRHGPAFVADMLAVVPVPIVPLLAGVNGVVAPGQEQPVPVHRSERAARRNRAGGFRQRADGRRLRVHLRDRRSPHGVDELLAGHEEPGRRRPGSGRGDRVPFHGADRRIGHHHQDRARSRSTGDRNRQHVRDGRTEVGRDELRQARPASAAQAPGDVVFRPDVNRPRRRVGLLPCAVHRTHAAPADHTLHRKTQVLGLHRITRGYCRT